MAFHGTAICVIYWGAAPFHIVLLYFWQSIVFLESIYLSEHTLHSAFQMITQTIIQYEEATPKRKGP